MSLSDRDAALIAAANHTVAHNLQHHGSFYGTLGEDFFARIIAAARAEGVAALQQAHSGERFQSAVDRLIVLRSELRSPYNSTGDAARAAYGPGGKTALSEDIGLALAALQQAGEPVAWRPIETAPKGPGWSNPINDFLPDNLGPLILMSIPFSPEPATTVGFWCPEYECWRHLADDGPHDIGPTHWAPFPLPQQTALVEPYSPELDEIKGRLA